MLSCSFSKRSSQSSTCIFDKTTLSVIGRDSVEYGCYTPQNIQTKVMYWLLDVSLKKGYYMRSIDDKNINNKIDFKICNCKDIAWAKQQILNEIAIQHPYRIIDSFITHRYYDFVIRDTSNIYNPHNDNTENMMGNRDLGNGLELIYNLNYETIIFEAFRHYIDTGGAIWLEVGNVTPSHMKGKFYNIIYPWRRLSFRNRIIPKDEYVAYMRDSVGVEVSLGREEFQPVKMIIFEPTENQYADTVCVKKHYEIKLVDSSLLQKSVYESTGIGGNFSGNINDHMIYYGSEYKDIGKAIVPKPFLSNKCGQSVAIMLDSLPGRYDIKVFPNFAKSVTKEDAYIKMVRDSLGFEIKWIKDEIILNK